MSVGKLQIIENSGRNLSVAADIRKESIEKLRTLIIDDGSMANFQGDDQYLLRFLYSCSFDIEAAFSKVKFYYQLVRDFPDWFTTEGPLDKKRIIEMNTRIMIPSKDKDGRPIYLIKLGNVDVSKLSLVDVVGLDDIWLEYIMSEVDAVKLRGLSVIVDVKNFSYKMMRWMTPHNTKIAVKKIEAYPIVDFKIHVVNTSMLMNAAIGLVWPFFSARIKEMIKFHYSDLESLRNHIDEDNLPREYGGTLNVNFQKCYGTLFERGDEIQNRLKLYHA